MSTRTKNAVAKKQTAAKKGNAKPAAKVQRNGGKQSKQQTVTMTQERTSKRFIVVAAEKLIPRLYVSKALFELLGSDQKQADITFESPRVTNGGKLSFAEVGEAQATCGLYLIPEDAAKLGITDKTASVKARIVRDGKNVKLTVLA